MPATSAPTITLGFAQVEKMTLSPIGLALVRSLRSDRAESAGCAHRHPGRLVIMTAMAAHQGVVSVAFNLSGSR